MIAAEGTNTMRERNREIKRRRQRCEKRKRLRKKLATADSDSTRREIESKILKTFPRYTPELQA